MDVIAGVDVGNSTTEVLLADVSGWPPRALVWDRMPTRGRKGSEESARAAAGLVARLARRHGLTVGRVACAPQQPVDTWTATDEGRAPDTGPLTVLARSTGTPGRPGYGAGRPVDVRSAKGEGPVVLCVPAGVGYRQAVAFAERTAVRIAAVLLADDEGVLVANRLPGGFPVLDGADVGAALAAERVAVEVSPPGAILTRLADPIRLAAELGVDDRAAARAVAASLADSGNAAVAVGNPCRSAEIRPVPEDEAEDTWQVELAAVAAAVEARRDAVTARGVARSALVTGDPGSPADVLAELLGVPVEHPGSEARAAHAGALTTPGARPGALVLDLGAGTIDVLHEDGHRVLAGAGDLVTAGTAMLLGIPRSTADWAKRGPCLRLDGPHVAVAEDGTRTFLDRPAPAAAVGALTVPGPAGPLPFHRGLAPAEWRALRRRLKRAAIADNLARALPEHLPADVLLAGGVAGDPEILAVLDAVLPGASVGRADVAGGGGPGHRHAVAYGLTLLAAARAR